MIVFVLGSRAELEILAQEVYWLSAFRKSRVRNIGWGRKARGQQRVVLFGE